MENRKGSKIMNRPKLKIIHGGLEDIRKIGNVLIIASPDESPPFEPDAEVKEEDTFLIMSPPRQDMKVMEESLTRLMTKLLETEPIPPGTVIVKEGFPVRLIAIIYDVNQEPIWKSKWIESALIRIFEESESRKIKSLSMPMLGTVYGKMPVKEFINIFTAVLLRTTPQYPRRLWLRVPYGDSKKITGMMDDVMKNSDIQ